MATDSKSIEANQLVTKADLAAMEARITRLIQDLAQKAKPEEALLTVKEAAELLRVGEEAIRRSIREGHYKATGRAGKRLIARSELLKPRK